MDTKRDSDPETDSLKRKSKSPSLLSESETKRAKFEPEEQESHEDIAKQYKKYIAAPKFDLNSEELYCVCRKPDVDGQMMISCDGCEEWFHTKCMRIDSSDTPLLDQFYCKFCQWKGDGVTKWNRKCRMPDCLKPARKAEKSKYCSDKCGEAFLKLQIKESQVFSMGEISFVVNYCKSHAALSALGSTFPELPEVALLDIKRLPAKVQSMLSENDQMQQDVNAEIEACKTKSQYLLQVKEMISVINSRIQATSGALAVEESTTKSKKKKSKSKKIDLCCFQSDLNNLFNKPISEVPQVEGDINEIFQVEIESAVKRFGEDVKTDSSRMCLEDRRKCLRHNGWFNLLNDRVWKRLMELQAVVEKLQEGKIADLRSYSISVYENNA